MFREPSERVHAPAARSAARTPTACFSLVAEPEPGVMPRVLEMFAKRGLVPTVWHSRIGPTGELTVDIQVAGMDGGTARYVADCMRAIWGVATVLTADKG